VALDRLGDLSDGGVRVLRELEDSPGHLRQPRDDERARLHFAADGVPDRLDERVVHAVGRTVDVVHDVRRTLVVLVALFHLRAALLGSDGAVARVYPGISTREALALRRAGGGMSGRMTSGTARRL